MHVVVLVLMAAFIAAMQSSSLAHAANAPDLILVMTVWTVNHSGATAGWLRAWAIGLVAAGLVPAGGAFMVIATLLAAVTAKTCGRILDRHHTVGQFVAGSLAVSVVAAAEAITFGLPPGHQWAVLESALWSGGILALVTWLMRGVPRGFWPVGQRESAW